MNDKPTLILLGEIKGTLDQFKDDTVRRFDELKDVIKVANDRADKAEKKAVEAHQYAKGIVNRAIWTSTAFVAAFSTFLWFLKTKAIAAVFGIH